MSKSIRPSIVKYEEEKVEGKRSEGQRVCAVSLVVEEVGQG